MSSRTAVSQVLHLEALDDKKFASYRQIVRHAVPLVLSSASGMLMQFVDRVFLAWHSPASVAGAGTAGMMAICLIGFCAGVTGYTNVFVAQYLGAGRAGRVGPSVWQGLYLAIAFGIVMLPLAAAAEPLYRRLGHDPAVQAAEIEYFRVMMLGGAAFLVGPAAAGFFLGRHDNTTVMMVQIGGALLNIALDYALIFGHWGFPAWGVAGAAWATVAAQTAISISLLVLFWRRRHRQHYDSWHGRDFEPRLCRRLLRYGAPAGLRVTVELLFWSVFLVLVGRVGGDELAATNVAFAINSLAWQPILGVATAVTMLVGRAQGASRPDLSRRAMWRGVVIGQLWMLAMAAVFVLAPESLLSLFFRSGAAEAASPEEQARLMRLGVVLLRFVAAYCLLDVFNVVFNAALSGAGDTWWLFCAMTAASLAAGAALGLLDWAGAGLYPYWTLATLFVLSTAVLWYWRYRGGAWEKMRVVEPVVIDRTE